MSNPNDKVKSEGDGESKGGSVGGLLDLGLN